MTRISRIFGLTIFLFFLLVSVQAQKTDIKLQRKIESLINGFHGEIGVYIKDLKGNKIASINEDTTFPTASIVKVPILMGIMHKINKKELDYHQKLTWVDTLNYDPGEDIVSYLKPQSQIELSKVMMLMMTISDNNASLWLQAIAGTGKTINALMDSLGYSRTRVNSRTPGREADRAIYGWGQTTPSEMASVFEDIVDGKIINREISDMMLRIMGRQYWDEEALSSLPPDVYVASKNGAVNASRSEVLYVKGKRPYIFSVFTKNNNDISWEHNNEAWQLTRALSKMVWEHFNN
jgi:beta-lactamase class A